MIFVCEILKLETSTCSSSFKFHLFICTLFPKKRGCFKELYSEIFKLEIIFFLMLYSLHIGLPNLSALCVFVLGSYQRSVVVVPFELSAYECIVVSIEYHCMNICIEIARNRKRKIPVLQMSTLSSLPFLLPTLVLRSLQYLERYGRSLLRHTGMSMTQQTDDLFFKSFQQDKYILLLQSPRNCKIARKILYDPVSDHFPGLYLRH
jgi:hypothetical protein